MSDGEGQVSEAGSSFGGAAGDGADSVPDTPDGVPEDNIGDADRDDYERRGRDVQEDQGEG